MKRNISNERGFGRLDLVATLTIVAALGLWVGSAVGAGPATGQMCMENMQNMMRAFHLYTADNGDYLPLVNDVLSAQARSSWMVHRADTLPDATNSAKLLDPQYSSLAPYLSGGASVFKCPADTSVVQVAPGVSRPGVRSVSMNHAMGTKFNSAGVREPSDGPWLDGTHTHFANLTWRTFGRLADMVRPRPSELFVFLDERAQSINDGTFANVGIPTTFYRWVDYPGIAHNGGAGFGFADGHGEIHVWQRPDTLLTPPGQSSSVNVDIYWLGLRSTALIE